MVVLFNVTMFSLRTLSVKCLDGSWFFGHVSAPLDFRGSLLRLVCYAWYQYGGSLILVLRGRFSLI